MPKPTKLERKLFKQMRQRGLRKRTARNIAEAVGKVQRRGERAPKSAQKVVKNMRSMLGDVEDRLAGGPEKRSEAAHKAARTRQRKSAKRSEAARKAAKTRAHAA